MYRIHAVACPRSLDHRPGGRCDCPLSLVVPGASPGKTRQVRHAGPIGDARAERRRLLAAGRIEVAGSCAEDADIQTLHDLVRVYFHSKTGALAPSTLKGHNEAYIRHIAGPLGDVPLEEISRRRVAAWIATVAQEHSRHAVWKARHALRTFLREGVEWGLIEENPAAGLRLPRAHGDDDARKGARRVLALEQIRVLAEACTEVRTECMLRVSAEAALRPGEVIGLRWGDLDLQRRRLTVARSVWQEPGRRGAPPTRHVKPPKTGKGAVALSAGLATRLGELFAQAVVEQGADASSWVFPGKSGGPMDSSTPNRMLRRACVRAGLVDDVGKPLVSWYGLRHSAASNMLALGVPLPDVAAQLRHADPGTTARVYSHVLGEDRQHAAASVFDVLERTETLRETLREAGGES